MMYTSKSLFSALSLIAGASAFAPNSNTPSSSYSSLASSITTGSAADTNWFTADTKKSDADVSILSTNQLKAQVLQLGAALDRGQAYNPTSGAYYSGSMLAAKKKIQELVSRADPDVNIPKSLKDIEGEWELILTTVPHGIFRSSPFFLAIQEAFEFAEDGDAFGEPKANLFFKLHELQTCSWGASKVGRVAQMIDPYTSYLYSEFYTSLFSLTVIPIIGWFKLMPTFGGCVITASKCELKEGGKLEMTVDYTTSRPVPGLSGLGEWIWSLKVPVGAVWKLLPWNKGREANCSVEVKYYDDDFRIVQDLDGELFVYTRPVVPREFDIKEEIKTER
jgi:hypothetical protein